MIKVSEPSQPEMPVVQFPVFAEIEEWREIPVAARNLNRGERIGDADIVRARMRLQDLPKDVATREQDLVGLETKQPLAEGEIFRRAKVVVPPTITAGSKVTLRYRSQFFDATASGVSLENGAVGEQIKVRNESSKKVVSARVVEAGLAEVDIE
jgi:flagella basal body P-ring formation protein FlgA